MYGRSDQPSQHWSVRAEFTISHPGADNPENPPHTDTVRGEDGVKMTYSWSANETARPEESPARVVDHWPSNNSSHAPSDSSSNTVAPDYYAYQRGNLLFTSTPPKRVAPILPERPPITSEMPRRGVDSSGYGSDLLSPVSLRSGSVPRKFAPSCGRKCRSTYNIVLSSNIHERDTLATQCGRTHSLRCQTPNFERREDFYGCGDPWCHHLQYCDDLSARISPVLEACEDSSTPSTTKRPSRASTFTSADHRTVNKKDASVQTFEMIDKSTSPYLRSDSFNFNKSPQPFGKATGEKQKKKYNAMTRRRNNEYITQRDHSASSFTPDSLDSGRSYRNISKLIPKKELSPIDSESLKKPRTVHIDVYCTGTEMDSDGSSSTNESDSKTASTPQTVFESEKVRITHKQAQENDIPFHLRTKPKNAEEYEEDTASTSYPSKMSSYSTIPDISASVSSVPRSWTSYSMSSCTVPEDYDSIANTSWKDTFSDIESLLQSRSSLAATESLDFVPRKLYEKNASIDETPEIETKDILQTPSVASLQPSDSFEYANSEDKLRIKRMEEFLKSKNAWRNPKTLLMQQKKMQEYMESKIKAKKSPKWESKDSESDDSDESEKGWTFVKGDSFSRPPPLSKSNAIDQGSLSDSNSPPTPCKSNSFLVKQRLSLDPSVRSPFTIVPGIYTEPRSIARKFGAVVSFMKKPGHHVGPAKNPDCMCDHCQSYWEGIRGRNRTRSMGDSPTRYVQNWKEFLEEQNGNDTKRTLKKETN